MIIQDGKVISDRDDKINCINTTDYTVYYKGLIFVTGEKCGQDSIKYIVRNLQSYENFKFKTIFGNFFIYIIDHIHKRQFIFIDNSGIFKAYKYKDCISTSFTPTNLSISIALSLACSLFLFVCNKIASIN